MKRVKIGEVITKRMPFSEVMSHMNIAGKLRSVKILEEGAQVLNDDGTDFSFPVTHGEAGIYRDTRGLYITDAAFNSGE